MLYRLGRVLQFIGLVLLPCSLAAVMTKNEKEAITFLLAGVDFFAVGYFLCAKNPQGERH
jgi:hypothetical protein